MDFQNPCTDCPLIPARVEMEFRTSKSQSLTKSNQTILRLSFDRMADQSSIFVSLALRVESVKGARLSHRNLT
jgi:hypothetical protein